MLQKATRSEILMRGHLMAIRYGAPLEIAANLLRLAQSSDPLPVSAPKALTLPVLQEDDAE